MGLPQKKAAMLPSVVQEEVQRPRKFRPKTLNLLYLAGNAMPLDQIAAVLSLPLRRVQQILATRRGQYEAAQIAFKVNGEDPRKCFDRLLPEAIMVNAEIMRNPNVKSTTRLMASMNIQDRVLGKPREIIDVQRKSQIRILLEKIHETESPRVIDAEFSDVIPQAQPREVVKEAEEKTQLLDLSVDEVTDWIKENL